MPDSACTETLDPRIRRTRELLQQALGVLLETRSFEKISVQDITDAATVNRATFYAHYPDKFALLECLVAARFHALLASRGVAFDGTCNRAIYGIVLGVCDSLAQSLDRPAGAEQPRQLEPHMETAIVAVVRAMILHGMSNHPDNPSCATAEMRSAAAAWAIYGAAREWVRTPDRDPSEEIAATVFELVAPVLGIDGSILRSVPPPVLA